jgi:cholesterol transport system auxiliary component
MNLKTRLVLGGTLLLLMACSPVKLPVTSEYQLNAFSARQFVAAPKVLTLLVTPPEAAAGYQTEQMLYVKKPFQVEAFAKNAWTSPPGEMVHPLMVQSLQKTGFFTAVTTSSYATDAEYRLDTQLIRLEQNFLKRPSTLEFSAKVALTRVGTRRIVASKTIILSIPCPEQTPYGGVIAANRAVLQFTAAVSAFVVEAIAKN